MADLPPDYALWRPADPGEELPARAHAQVAILLVRQASLSNVVTVYEDLRAVNTLEPRDAACERFDIRILAEEPGPFRSLSGLTLDPHGTLDDQRFDAVILPTLFDDGCLTDPDHPALLSPAQRAWILDQHAGGAVFTTTCSGVYLLAETGLLNGHAAAMNTLYAAALAERYPDVAVQTRRPLVVSGPARNFVTGGDSIYSADVSLFNIARFMGPDLALRYARLYGKTWTEALHDHAEPGTAPDAPQDRMMDLARSFILGHLSEPGVVGAAAELANVSPRTFSRRFRRAIGRDPRSYVTDMRMARARDLLARSRMPIEDIAHRLGYADRTSFTKTFRARNGLPPAEYRMRFQGAAGLSPEA